VGCTDIDRCTRSILWYGILNLLKGVRLPPLQIRVEFTGLEMAHTSEFLMENVYNSRILSPQTEQVLLFILALGYLHPCRCTPPVGYAHKQY